MVALSPGIALIVMDVVSVLSSQTRLFSSSHILIFALAALLGVTFVAFLCQRLFPKFKLQTTIALLLGHLVIGLGSHFIELSLPFTSITVFSMGLIIVYGVLAYDPNLDRH